MATPWKQVWVNGTTCSVTYRETELFRSAGLFRSYANFITAIAQTTKIIKLNHLYLYHIQTITFKLCFRSIDRLLFLFMASNEDPNMKAKNVRRFLYFSFLIFYLQYILVEIYPSNVEGLGTIWLNIVGAWDKQKRFQKLFYLHKNDLIESAPFPRGYFDHFY